MQSILIAVRRPASPPDASAALVWLIVGNAMLGIPAGAFDQAGIAAAFVFATLGAWIYSARLLRRSGWKPPAARGAVRAARTILALIWEVFCIGVFVWAAETDVGGVIFAVVILGLTSLALAKMMGRTREHGLG